MGTNYYLRSKTPKEYYPEYHLTKTSAGWRPLWQVHTTSSDDMNEPNIRSINDIKNLVKSGEWEILDEYDRKISWDEFNDRVINWGGSKTNKRDHSNLGVVGFTNPDGTEWTYSDFC